MFSLRVVTSLDECREIWDMVMPRETITDLWEVRACFHHHFKRRPKFIVAEDSKGICGMLPLSWIDESGRYGYFPGETWAGKTWLEQNRIFFRSHEVLKAILSLSSSSCHLRYLSPLAPSGRITPAEDEIGYLFFPPQYGYKMENYFREFSRKSIKQILRSVASIESLGVSIVYDDFSDFDLMVRMNLSRFEAGSYFHDKRFRESFRSLAGYLAQKGWLRFTKVLIDSEPAAIDMGCMYNNVYTLLAGGTNSNYPGVAKLINLHHLKRACQEQIDCVDFMCGDFTWKKLFHLTPRPLYLLSSETLAVPVERRDTRRAMHV
jgi:hypothetical protein